MAHRMAHDHPAGIAAIASLAGADQSVERPTPSEPVHVLQIHGDADTAIALKRNIADSYTKLKWILLLP